MKKEIISGENALLLKYKRDIVTENGLPQALFEEIEAVIRDYCGYNSYRGIEGKDYRPPIRHGDAVLVGGQSVSWHFNPLTGDRVTVCLKWDKEWNDDQWLDEIPLPFLLHIIDLIQERRPFGDQRPPKVEETIKKYLRAQDNEKLFKKGKGQADYLRGIFNDE